MPQENVGLGRRGYEALASGDMQTVLAGLDAAIEVRPIGQWSPITGPRGVLRYAEQWLEGGTSTG